MNEVLVEFTLFVTFLQNKIILENENGSVFMSSIHKSLSGHLQSVAIISIYFPHLCMDNAYILYG